jgi:hypothetical protein
MNYGHEDTISINKLGLKKDVLKNCAPAIMAISTPTSGRATRGNLAAG